MNIAPIIKISDIIDRAIEIQGDQLFWMFRGEKADHPDWKLQPKIWRKPPPLGKTVEQMELELFARFQHRGALHDKTPREQLLYWLLLAQHHGLPTRLLDWSTNPLVAAFFAVEEENPIEFQGNVLDRVIYAYKPIKRDYDFHKEPFSVNDIVRVIPDHITNRIQVQSSVFTLHPPEKKVLEIHEGEELYKIVIPHSARERIYKELYRLNINRGTLFPDLDNIARNVTWEETTSLQLPAVIDDTVHELMRLYDRISGLGLPLPPPPPPPRPPSCATSLKKSKKN